MPVHRNHIASSLSLMAALTLAVTAAPSLDVILVMDNTGSMANAALVDGIPRWCLDPDLEPTDPGCISGDPDWLRGPILQSLVDSLAGFAGNGVALIRFSEFAESPHDSLVLLDSSTREALKAAIIMKDSGRTNYTAALRTAIQLLKGSTKPRSHQAIVFLSDGRPNAPSTRDEGPFQYKDFWDSLPPVHGIFMEGNPDNRKDLQDLAVKTGGSFHSFGPGRSIDTLLSMGILPSLRNVTAVSLPYPRGNFLSDKPDSRHAQDALGRRMRPSPPSPAKPRIGFRAEAGSPR
jgi:hypothetical protein